MAKTNQTAQDPEISEKLAALTAKQYKFYLALVEGLSDIAAYRAAYTTENMSDADCAVEAWRLKQNPKISPLIEHLRFQGLYQAIDDRKAHLRRLRQLSARAETSGNYGAAVQAEVSAGKVEGHYIERTEDLTPRRAVESFSLEFEKFVRVQEQGEKGVKH